MGSLIAIEMANKEKKIINGLSLLGTSHIMAVHPDLINESTSNIINASELMTDWSLTKKQHIGYNPSCEMGRIDEILDELRSTRTIFIRWNPDYCKINGKQLKKNRKERLIELGVESFHNYRTPRS